MRGKLALTIVLVASLLMVGAMGSVSAGEVGSSGSCDNDTDGDGEVDNGADSDVAVTTDGDIDEPEPESTVAGFAWLAENQGECERSGNDDGDAEAGYIEAHATGDQGTVQVCVDDDAQNDPSQAVTANQEGNNRCPTDQSGDQ